MRGDPRIELREPGVPSGHDLRRLPEQVREQPPLEIANELTSCLRHSEEGRPSKQRACIRGHRVGRGQQFCTSRNRLGQQSVERGCERGHLGGEPSHRPLDERRTPPIDHRCSILDGPRLARQ